MKKIFAILISVASFCFGAHGETTYDEYDAIISVRWTGSTSDEKLVPLTLSDGSALYFAYWTWDNEVEMYFKYVLEQCEAQYTVIQTAMLKGGKISAAQAKANMKWWKNQIDAAIKSGYEQQILNNKQELDDFAKQYNTDSEEYAEKFAEYLQENDDLQDDVNLKLSSLQTKINNDIATLKGNLNTATETLNNTTKALSATKDKSESEINALKAAQERAAANVASLQKALNALKDTTKSSVSGSGNSVSYGSYSNDVKRITKWLGSSNEKNYAAFVAPVNPVTSNKYGSAANIVDWMFDFGLVGYNSIEAMMSESRDSANLNKYYNNKVRKFQEKLFVNGSAISTNVNASFKAPYNWADGLSIVSDDGVYGLNSFSSDTNDFPYSLSALMQASTNVEGIAEEMLYAKSNTMVLARYNNGTDDNPTNILVYLPLGDMASSNPDNRSVRIVNKKDKDWEDTTNIVIEVYGFQNATNESAQIGESFSDKVFSTAPSNLIVPVKEGKDGTMKWIPLANYSISETNSGMSVICASNRSEQIDRYVTLAHWSEVTNSEESTERPIGDLMLDAASATNIMILAKNLDDNTLHYIKLGKVRTDDMSIITTNLNDDESHPTNGLSLYGFFDAHNNQSPMKFYDDENETYKLVWTNFNALGVDNLSMQIWQDKRPNITNDAYMVNGFVQKNVEEKDFATLVFEEEPDENYGAIQVLARKAKSDAKFDGTTNGFELVYVDIGNTNIETSANGRISFRKLRKSLDGFTNELFRAGGFTNTFSTVTNDLLNAPFDVINATNLLDNASVWTNGEKKIEVKGFKEARDKSYIVKRIDDSGEYLKWEDMVRNDGDIVSLDNIYSSIETLADYDLGEDFAAVSTNVFTIAGFPTAETNTVPVKVKNPLPFGQDEYTIEWRDIGAMGGATTFVGTDGSRATTTGTNIVTFAAMEDSNVKVSVTTNATGVLIKFGVYWK